MKYSILNPSRRIGKGYTKITKSEFNEQGQYKIYRTEPVSTYRAMLSTRLVLNFKSSPVLNGTAPEQPPLRL